VANSGVQPGSASVAGFPSVSASRIAVIGRQKLQWYLSFLRSFEARGRERGGPATEFNGESHEDV
jgi:hypothetical protein